MEKGTGAGKTYSSFIGLCLKNEMSSRHFIIPRQRKLSESRGQVDNPEQVDNAEIV